jgi:hypothetical protein
MARRTESGRYALRYPPESVRVCDGPNTADLTDLVKTRSLVGDQRPVEGLRRPVMLPRE